MCSMMTGMTSSSIASKAGMGCGFLFEREAGDLDDFGMMDRG
jgi:hypothetical protein